MSVRAHPEQDEVEARQLAGFEPENGAQFLLVLLRRFIGPGQLTVDAVHLSCFEWGLGQKGLLNYPEIAFRGVRRHVPLVSKKQLHFAPGHHRLQQPVVSEEFVQCFRRRTTCKRDAEAVLLVHGLPGRL